VVNSARVSYGKHTDSISAPDQQLIKYLLEHQHTSPLEHCAVTFRFTVPVYISKQHMRHRTWSYNEISRRYTSEKIDFYDPDMGFRAQGKDKNLQRSDPDEIINPMLESGALAATAVQDHHQGCLKLYNELLDAGIAREQARGILPQNMYTEYYGTANLNNILKFVALRLPIDSQWEIQKVAKAVLEITKDCFPITTKYWMRYVAQKSQCFIDDWFDDL